MQPMQPTMMLTVSISWERGSFMRLSSFGDLLRGGVIFATGGIAGAFGLGTLISHRRTPVKDLSPAQLDAKAKSATSFTVLRQRGYLTK